MNRHTANNLVVDIVAFASFVLLAATGLVERYVLPPGTGHFQSLWGLDRHQWGEVHFWIAMVLMGVLAVHVLLHWKWIVSVMRKRETEASGWRLLFGLVGLVGLVGLSLAPFLATVEQTGEPGARHQQEDHQRVSPNKTDATTSDQIRGSMTLADVEQTTGVSAAVVARELGLPSDVPRDENLGRLRRQFDFNIDDVRKIINDNSLSDKAARP